MNVSSIYRRKYENSKMPMRVLQFVLAISEVNTKLALTNLYEKEALTQIIFRKQLAYELINCYGDLTTSTQEKRKRNVPLGHTLVVLKPYHNFRGTKTVKMSARVVQLRCFCGKNRCNTYCTCIPGTFYCNICFIRHVIDMKGLDSVQTEVVT